MSFLDANVAVAPACGIQELNFDEIDQVNGGNLRVIIRVISWILGAELTSDSQQQ